MPLAAIGQMPEAELGLWMRRGKPLWPRRLEILLAQVTSVLAQVNGNKVAISDFDLFDESNLINPELGAAAESLADITGAGVRKLGQGRKKSWQQEESEI